MTPEELNENTQENTEEEDLNEDIEFEVEDADVIPSPIDPTLTHPGEAADAYATGQAIAGALSDLKVNGQSANEQHEITVLATQMKMDGDENAQTVAQAIEAVQNRTANDITYGTEGEGQEQTIVTVKGAIDGIKTDMNTGLTEEEITAIYNEVMEQEDEE